MPRSLAREAQEKRGQDGEVTRCDDADLQLPCPRLDLGKIGVLEAAGADDDGDPSPDGGQHVLLHDRRVGVVDEDVALDSIERLRDGRVDEALAATVDHHVQAAAGGRARHSGDELEIVGRADSRRDGRSGPAGDAGYAHADHRARG